MDVKSSYIKNVTKTVLCTLLKYVYFCCKVGNFNMKASLDQFFDSVLEPPPSGHERNYMYKHFHIGLNLKTGCSPLFWMGFRNVR